MKTFIAPLLALLTTLSLLSSPAQASPDNKPDAQAEQAQRLIDTHFEIWNSTDQQARMAKFRSVYDQDVTVADYGGIATGYVAVNHLIERVQTQHPGFKFTPDPVQWNHGFGRVTWGFGPNTNPNAVRGEDIFTMKNGKVASFRVFLDR